MWRSNSRVLTFIEQTQLAVLALLVVRVHEYSPVDDSSTHTRVGYILRGYILRRQNISLPVNIRNHGANIPRCETITKSFNIAKQRIPEYGFSAFLTLSTNRCTGGCQYVEFPSFTENIVFGFSGILSSLVVRMNSPEYGDVRGAHLGASTYRQKDQV